MAGKEHETSTVVNPIQVQKFLGGVDYPTTKDDLVMTAKDQGADENVVSTLENMPMDKFNSPNDVTETIGKMK